MVSLPRKRFFRQRAHANPFVDHDLEYPLKPSLMNWSAHYPQYFDGYNGSGINGERIEFVDIGCGYGGLSFALAEAYPDKLVLGMEIRDQVTEYVHQVSRSCSSFSDGS